jgi:hypothetical protein
MAAISPQQRTEWTRLTDRLTAEFQGYDVTVEVVGPEIGDNRLVERLPFDTLTYDHADDVVVVGVGSASEDRAVALRHLVHHPQELVVDLNPLGAALKIVDSTGTTTLVSLLRPPDGADGKGS